MKVLGIESSCDETGVALIDSEKGLLADAVHTQIDMHRAYGGVVPELASRDHIRRALVLIDDVLSRAGVKKEEIDAVAVTEGPGLAGALLVGSSVAHAIGYALGIPVVGVHHLEGHLLSACLADPAPTFPFIALLVSGGHTQFMRVNAFGSYELLGQEVANLKERERTKFRKGNLGFVFQSFNLIDELNVFENVELPLKYLNIGAAERKQRVTEILKRMNISHRSHHFPQQLSGGQQQRVAIARAVVSNPKLVLADEPTGNLDSKNGKEVMDLLTELNSEGTTIVMVTHSQKDASVAQRIINLFDGRIVGDVRNEL